MTQLVLYTRSILPPPCLFTMGVNVKENENPIGFFGTGLKYAIAVILRLHGKITIKVIEDGEVKVSYVFEVEKEKIRNKDFNIIYAVDDIKGQSQRMPMTTDYGKAWAPWMALRELYSNTIDEGGEIWSENEPRRPRDRSGTYITVDCDEVTRMWEPGNRNDWLLNTNVRQPVWANDEIEVYLQSSDTLFYRGIRVSSRGFKGALTYNLLKLIDHLKLTEDRTIDTWDFQYHYAKYLVQVNERDICRKILEASGNNEHAESGLYLSSIHENGSMQMQEEALRLYRLDPNLMNSMARDSIAVYIRKHHFDEMYQVAQLTEEQERRTRLCISLLESRGVEFHKYKIRWCNNIDALGQADFNTNTIIMNVIKNLDKENWMEVTCTTLIEEYIHLEFGVADSTRAFQNAATKLIYEVMRFGRVERRSMLDDLVKEFDNP